MKFCSRCGVQNDDTALFCKNCGSSFNSNTYQQQAPNNQTNYQQPYFPQQQPQPQPKPLLSPNPAINVVKRAGSSVLFLIAAIVFTLVMVFQAIQVIQVFSDSQAAGTLSAITAASGEVKEIITTIVAIVLILLFVLNVLILAGMWMFFASSANKGSPNVSTSGLTMIKVNSIIQLVIYSILLVVSLIVVILAIAAISELISQSSGYGNLYGGYYSTQISDVYKKLKNNYIITAIILAAIIPLMIVYYVKIFKTIKTISFSIVTGNPSNNVSIFVVVINFLLALLNIITLFIIKQSVISIIISLLFSAFFIIIGVGIILYRKNMTDLRMPNIFAGQMPNQYNPNYNSQYQQQVNNQQYGQNYYNNNQPR